MASLLGAFNGFADSPRVPLDVEVSRPYDPLAIDFNPGAVCSGYLGFFC